MKQKDWAPRKPGDVCQQGSTWRARFGTYLLDGVEFCCSCGGKVSQEADEQHENAEAERLSAQGMIQREMITTLSELPGYRIVKHHGIVSVVSSASGWTAAAKGQSAASQSWREIAMSAVALGGNAVVGIQLSAFGARGGITNVVGGDAVGVVVAGSVVTVEPVSQEEA